jgi:hypothetical protein
MERRKSLRLLARGKKKTKESAEKTEGERRRRFSTSPKTTAATSKGDLGGVLERRNKKILDLYKDPGSPASFTSLNTFYDFLKTRVKNVSKEKVRDLLLGERVYTQFRPKRNRFPRRVIKTIDLNREWDCDVVYLQNFAEFNDGYSYLLLCIDHLSKRVILRPLKNHTSETVISVFKDIFTQVACPEIIRVDLGSEFLSQDFVNFCKIMGVKVFYAYNTETKANLAERAIKTILSRIKKYMFLNHTKRYVDIVSKVEASYNNTPHSSLPAKLTPNRVNSVNLDSVVARQRDRYTKATRPLLKAKYKPGDHVRMSRLSPLFQKGYEVSFTTEIFIIKALVSNSLNIPQYLLTDSKGELIKGTFYEEELTPCHPDPTDTVYLIERILKSKKQGGKTFHLVKWVDFHKKDSTWIPASDILDPTKKKSVKKGVTKK